jgi:hypothetical protein
MIEAAMVTVSVMAISLAVNLLAKGELGYAIICIVAAFMELYIALDSLKREWLNDYPNS